ncbi:Ig-like domain-containing protein [Dyadobacter sp. CY107]|uniref:Ig-like domain-containing protein n=1 Tax=Dyadobacter fanqingshengii TaxID=2906443 RepID=UPI001F38C46E|nr:Ig-like domain-containing protein [Dyadobacter fanqingshengii]MCF2502654.1 Ig-like domain-containing protein [Dyadobacter fanqingshengii]
MMFGLIFFVWTSMSGCKKKEQDDRITIRWKEKKAVSVSFSGQKLESVSEDALPKLVKITRKTSENQVAILGDFSKEGDLIVFEPLVPFTRGLDYQIYIQNQNSGTFGIPMADASDAPELVQFFPSADTLPENLLKVFLHFTHPMREGQSGKFVTLIKNDSDTIQGAFLDLQPELWNENRTILTLWLDPGRIKRDLQPNIKLGAPLQNHTSYQIIVSREWQDTNGGKLKTAFKKSFITTSRDSISPAPARWKLALPKRSTNQPIKVHFKESLDHSLLTETLSITTDSGHPLTGKWLIGPKEKSAQFTPGEPWNHNNYILQVETRLEDLAGNNVNRAFDRDVSKGNTPPSSAETVKIHFNPQK